MASGRIRNQVGAVSFVAGAVEHWPDLERPEIAFAGRSNVGKSSALNCILKRRSLARVSGRPGRTQEINVFAVGTACIFADLPGYGFARVPDAVKNRWKGMIGSYLAERDTLRLVVLLVDVRHAPQAMDGTLDEAKISNMVNNAIAGNPDEVADLIKQYFHPEDRLMLWFDFNNHNNQAVKDSMRTFMQQVKPQLPQ